VKGELIEPSHTVVVTSRHCMREFNLVRAEWQFPASYNVAPTDDVPVVRVNKQGIAHAVRGATPVSKRVNTPKNNDAGASSPLPEFAMSKKGRRLHFHQ
jgi:hypothetical protein